MSLVSWERPVKRPRTLATLEEASAMPKFYGDIVTVTIGDDTRQYLKSMLVKSSEFLKTELRRQRAAGTPQTIDLSGEDPVVFESYVGWLSTSMIDARTSTCGPQKHLAHLYGLGEKLVDETFKATVIDAIIEFVTEDEIYPSLGAVQIIYSKTGPGSPARRLMVDFWACAATPDWSEVASLTKEVCADFVDDLISALLKRRKKSKAEPWVTSPDSYHTMLDKKVVKDIKNTKDTKETKVETSAALVQHPVGMASPRTAVDAFSLGEGTFRNSSGAWNITATRRTY